MKNLKLSLGLMLIFLTIFSFSATAQNLKFYGILPAISQTGRISKKVNYNIFVSTTIDAFKETVNGVEYPASDLQFYFQPSLIYVYSPSFNLAASYVYQRNNPLLENFSNEHRFWQQAIFSIPVSSGKITNRFRFEERFIQNRTTQTYPLSTRARYQLGYNVPLQGKTLDKNEFYFNTYNEVYFSLTGVKNATYSENWTYIGVGYNTGKMGKLELGYLLQAGVRNKQKDIRFLNLVQVTWNTNFDFFGKKK